jgi:hypothetical protein
MLNFLGARTASGAAAETGHHFVTLQLTSSTQITVTRAESNSVSITVSYEVIEYY